MNTNLALSDIDIDCLEKDILQQFLAFKNIYTVNTQQKVPVKIVKGIIGFIFLFPFQEICQEIGFTFTTGTL